MKKKKNGLFWNLFVRYFLIINYVILLHSLLFVCLSIASGVVDVSLSFRGRVVRHIACGIVNIGLSNGVDESSVKGVVDKGGVSIGNMGGGIGQSVPRGSQGSIGESSIDKGSNGSSLVGWPSKSHGGEGKQSEALHDDCQARVSPC